MSSGSKDYWSTKDNWLYSLLTIVKEAVKEEGLIQVALDSMDGKLDGFVDLADLTEAQTVYLAKMFLTDTVNDSGLNLLTKLDALDGKNDGRLDLSQMKTFDIFYDSVAGKSRLEISIAQLVLTVEQLVGVHTDTTSMVAFGSESWSGFPPFMDWGLVASINDRRNMLRIDHLSEATVYFSRDGINNHGTLPTLGSVVFHDPPGVWLWLQAGYDGAYDAYEEWAT